MAGYTAHIMSPAELAQELNQLVNKKKWHAQLRKSYRPISTKAAAYARAEMRSDPSRQVAKAATTTRGHSTARGAQVRIGGKRWPGSLAAVWGTLGATGWYAGWYDGKFSWPRRNAYVGSRRMGARYNNPPWVGQHWTVARPNEGPRGVNRALYKHQPELVDEVGQVIDEFVTRAFPYRRS